MTSAIAIYPHGEPALCWLFAALAENHPLRGLAPTTPLDLVRLATGRARRDPLRPRALPLSPWGSPWSARFHGPLARRLAGNARTVILTRPDQAALLDAFSAFRTIYYAADDYAAYGRDWNAQEKRILAAANHVVAVSDGLATALSNRYPIPSQHLTISPNGVPERWIPAACPTGAAVLPERLDLPRPVAGIIGRISSRLRLDWLESAVARLDWLHWLFVGDVEEGELLPEDRPTLRQLQQHRRCRFIGARAYEALPHFAAAFDVALMPYSERSTNANGSPMRFFLQLPFGTPILATPGCRQVAGYAPLAKLCSSPEELMAALESLRAQNFDDGLRRQRWQAAREQSWEARARQLAPLIWPAEPALPAS